jgi:hypothetical protein
MKRVLFSGITKGACAFALIIGCARPPQQEITNVNNAIESAKAAKAPIFAEEQFRFAQAMVDSALADIRAQNSKSPFSHNYEKSKKMLLDATAAAEAAIAAVPANKAKIYNEAKALFDKTKATIDKSNKSLEELIKKKNKNAAFFKVRLDAVAASLPEDIAKVSDEALIMTRSTMGRTMKFVDSLKMSIEHLSPPKNDVKVVKKKSKKK